ncbi:MAG TPA: hypothetical protein VEY10_03920 [Flavisolibacter sp.]|jgi:hypothetical protein|nr:hypothetical protein [Flavisolibacter sp.]
MITGAAGTTGTYEGSEVSTGSQTPESITGSTDIFDNGLTGSDTGGDNTGNDDANTRG